MNGYGQCPRCGHMTMEHLKSHSHCWECGYFPESEVRLSIKKRLEAEAYSGNTFAQNERDNWDELLDEKDQARRLSDDEIDDYYGQVSGGCEDVL